MKEKKYSSVAAPHFLLFSYLETGITLTGIYLLLGVISLLTASSGISLLGIGAFGAWLTGCILFTVAMLVFTVIQGAVWSNAYRRFEIDDVGVRNRFYSVKWEKIDQISLCPLVMHRSRLGILAGFKKEFASTVCIGRPAVDFISLDPRCSVFFKLDRKNLEALRAASGGRSEKVNEFIEKYIEVV